MPFHIKNQDTDALARKVARLKGVGLTDAVHQALMHELEREQAQPSLSELAVRFCRELKARGDPAKVRPVDKSFYDELSGQ